MSAQRSERAHALLLIMLTQKVIHRLGLLSWLAQLSTVFLTQEQLTSLRSSSSGSSDGISGCSSSSNSSSSRRKTCLRVEHP